MYKIKFFAKSIECACRCYSDTLLKGSSIIETNRLRILFYSAMSKPKVYVTREITEEALDVLRERYPEICEIKF